MDLKVMRLGGRMIPLMCNCRKRTLIHSDREQVSSSLEMAGGAEGTGRVGG